MEQYDDKVRHPSHYMSGDMETIDKIDAVLGNCAKWYYLGCILKYVDRAGKKEGEDAASDLAKANNYAWRLVTGCWK